MRIKRFEARDMAEALRMVKREFGPDAVILSARNLTQSRMFGLIRRNGVEVTAAMDADASPDRGGVSVSLSGRRPPGVGPVNADGTGDELAALHQRLARHDVAEHLAWDLIGDISRRRGDGPLSPAEMRRLLAEAITQRQSRHRMAPPRRGGQRRIVFLGPAGVGKTTVVARLAALQLYGGRRAVGILGLDAERVGAPGQLESLARIIGVPFEIAAETSEVGEALRRLSGPDLLLVDTPGLSPADEASRAELRRRLELIEGAEHYLLLDAASSERHMAETPHRYADIGVHALIFTRLDEAVVLGPVLNRMLRAGLPTLYFTTGPRIPEDIRAASGEYLAERFLPSVASERGEQLPPPRPVTFPGGTISLEEPEPPTSGFPSISGPLPPSAPFPPSPASPSVTPSPEPSSPEPPPSAPSEASVPAAATGETPADTMAAAPFVATRNSTVFHRVDCRWALKIRAENAIPFASREEAESRRYHPCGYCLPPAPHDGPAGPPKGGAS